MPRKQLPPPPGGGVRVHQLQRHLVPIYFVFAKNGKRSAVAVTSFVMDVEGDWFLVTAGHCIKEIEATLAAGYVVERCLLIDSLGNDAKHKQPIPFDWCEERAANVCINVHEMDYGIVLISEFYRRGLAANGVRAFDAGSWDRDPEPGDTFQLLGVPIELSEIDPSQFWVTTTLHPVKQLPERPDCFAETNAPTFWGEVSLPEFMDDIAGMSGGPIIAYRSIGNGESEYWVHAVQSGWFKSRRAIRACLLRPLGIFLRELMNGQHRDALGDPPPDQRTSPPGV